MPRPARVLVVDDEVPLAEALATIFSDELEVSATTDPAAALEWMAGGDWYDVVLCDVEMRAMSAAEFHDRLSAMRPDLAARIVFVTGSPDEDALEGRLDAVPNLVLEKPVDFAALRELIWRRIRMGPAPRRAIAP